MHSLTERLVGDQSINQYQHQNLETGFTSGTPGRLIESNFNCGVVFEAKRQEVPAAHVRFFLGRLRGCPRDMEIGIRYIRHLINSLISDRSAL
jgi:hypothetical protein